MIFMFYTKEIKSVCMRGGGLSICLSHRRQLQFVERQKQQQPKTKKMHSQLSVLHSFGQQQKYVTANWNAKKCGLWPAAAEYCHEFSFLLVFVSRRYSFDKGWPFCVTYLCLEFKLWLWKFFKKKERSCFKEYILGFRLN